MIYFKRTEDLYRYIEKDSQNLKINRYILIFDEWLENIYIIKKEFENIIIYKNLELYQVIKQNSNFYELIRNEKILKCIPEILNKKEMTEYTINFFQTKTNLKLMEM